jgi:TonB family protein
MRSKMAALCGLALLLAVSAALALAQQEKIPAPKYDLPEVTHAEEVIYPVNAALPGTVVLQVSLDKEGKIEDVKTVRDFPPFSAEALKSVKKWKFKPARRDGKGVRSTMAIAFSFQQPSPVKQR